MRTISRRLGLLVMTLVLVQTVEISIAFALAPRSAWEDQRGLPAPQPKQKNRLDSAHLVPGPKLPNIDPSSIWPHAIESLPNGDVVVLAIETNPNREKDKTWHFVSYEMDSNPEDDNAWYVEIYKKDGSVVFLREAGLTGDICVDEQGDIFCGYYADASRTCIARYSQSGLYKRAYNLEKKENFPRPSIGSMVAFENKLYLLIAGEENYLCVLDLITGKEERFLTPGTVTVSRLGLDKQSRMLYMMSPGSGDNLFLKWDISSRQFLEEYIFLPITDRVRGRGLLYIRDFIVDREGNVYLSDRTDSVIHIWIKTKGYAGFYPLGGFGAGTTSNTGGINVDDDGNLLVGWRGRFERIPKEKILAGLQKPKPDKKRYLERLLGPLQPSQEDLVYTSL